MLAQHRRQRHQHPRPLLAVVLPLDRVPGGDHRALRGHRAREVLDLARGYAGDGGGPGGVLGLSVGGAEEVVLEGVEADGVGVEEALVVEVLAEQGVHHAEGEGDVGVGFDLDPVGVEVARGVVVERVDGDDRDPGVLQIRPLPGVVADRAHAAVHERIGRPDHDLLRVRFQDGPVRAVRVARPGDPGEDHRQRAGGVAADEARRAAVEVEELLEHGFVAVEVGVVGAPGALGGVERFVAVGALDALHLVGDEGEGVVPADADEVALAALGAVAVLAFGEEVAADHGVADARLVVQPVGHRLDPGAVEDLLRQRADVGDPAVLHRGEHRAQGGVHHHLADAPLAGFLQSGHGLRQDRRDAEAGERGPRALEEHAASELLHASPLGRRRSSAARLTVPPLQTTKEGTARGSPFA